MSYFEYDERLNNNFASLFIKFIYFYNCSTFLQQVKLLQVHGQHKGRIHPMVKPQRRRALNYYALALTLLTRSRDYRHFNCLGGYPGYAVIRETQGLEFEETVAWNMSYQRSVSEAQGSVRNKASSNSDSIKCMIGRIGLLQEMEALAESSVCLDKFECHGVGLEGFCQNLKV